MREAAGEPGFFSLTVPTGGGKTLSSLAFALRHAVANGLRRVVYVIPFTSIIEQNAAVFREIFAPLERELGRPVVLEHHSNLSPERETTQSRLAAENWDAPLVVTTAVQFYESLHAARTSRCRKVHAMARAVVILDEAQCLPVDDLAPCLDALRGLVREAGSSVVLCTATQPAVAKEEWFGIGLEGVREIVPDPGGLYNTLKRVRVPLHHLDGIVCFGWEVTASAALMAACAEAGVALSFHTPHGKFLAAVNGFTPGNILLRRAQYRLADEAAATLGLARNMVETKLFNARKVLLRAVRDHGDRGAERVEVLESAARALQNRYENLSRAQGLDELRGVEGEGAATYFAAFPQLLTQGEGELFMNGRNRRPPLDPVNALLSFLYALLAHDCRSALESCGLDSQCGYLHRDRPGRPSLALDLMEEFRHPLADRTALALMNRRQIDVGDFEQQEAGAWVLKEDSRKVVLAAWQERKKDTLLHPFLNEKITVGLLPHLQARLLARAIRGDIDAYPAFLWS